MDWSSLGAESLVADVREGLREAEEGLRRIEALPEGEAGYATVIEAMEAALDPVEDAWSLASHLDSVRNTPEFRAAYQEILPEVSAFFAGISLRPELWKRVQAAAERERGKLDAVRERDLEETVRDFREAGADLDPEAQERLRAIEAELAERTQKFGENVLDSTEAWERYVEDPAELDGVPPSVQEQLRADARAQGRGDEAAPAWRITLQAPSFVPILQYAHSEELRREVWEATTRIGATPEHDNREQLAPLLTLRREKAELLGFPDFAQAATARRMVGGGAEAESFVDDLHRRILPRFREEVEELEEFRAAQTGTERRRLEPWELGYWSERLRRHRYEFDEEELRAYFPIEAVQEGLFQLAQRVFGVRIERREVDPETQLWAPAVEFYDFYDRAGALLGSFYADWYPRKGKRDGAWMNPLRSGLPLRPERPQPHLGVICGNLTPPAGDRPSLLTHRDVETLFHEFGHLLHHLCSEVPVRSLAGTNVVWDFVELPSQLMENWCWERESLDLFARHHQTGEPIPEELFGRMRAARNFQSAMGTMRQLSFAKMDLALHRGGPFADGAAVLAFAEEVIADYRVPLRTEPPLILPRFGHLFSSPTGYAAGYYSYQYAEMLDADAFNRFQEEGLLSPAVGGEFRRAILARGNAAPAAELFRAFRGRDPDPEAFLRRAGLAG